MRRMIVVIAIAILAVVAILVFGAKLKGDVTAPHLYHPTLEAKMSHEACAVTISKSGEKPRSIRFSLNRKVLKRNGISPVCIKNFEDLVGMEKATVIERYGTPHTDVGSGFSFPAYITEDAYLISFYANSEGVVSMVSKEDLLGCERERVVWLDNYTAN